MKIIKKEDLNLPKAPAQAPQIDWGEDFLSWDVRFQNNYLKKLCSALNHATDIIQNERNDALKECVRMVECVENAEKAVAIQKAIVIKAITDHNAEKQNLIVRLQELEAELREKNVMLKLYEGE